jgi:hypothetical protein
MIQWTHVPIGASGSSLINAMLLAISGIPSHINGGDRSCPSHVYFEGIMPPSWNAGLLTEIAISRLLSPLLISGLIRSSQPVLSDVQDLLGFK